MSDSANIISVENLSKKYLIGHQGVREQYSSLRDSIARYSIGLARKTLDAMRGRAGLQGDEMEEFWALKDVSFEIKRGEVVGIIGRNGAGKSTLLKILSRITEPTSGRITLNGRVASLLEVGTGFHPELTGRENIYLNGAILGMTRAEIRRKFDEIVEFAGVDKFLDTPVKRYSSGMYVRLAFAVAAHLEPEILVVDEVLAVGDAEFQKKCLGKMHDVAKGGRTVLFVSHNLSAVASLCEKCLWLDSGSLRDQGTAQGIVNAYLSLRADVNSGKSTVDFEMPSDATVGLRQITIHQEGSPADTSVYNIAQPLQIRMTLELRHAFKDIGVAVRITRYDGIVAVHTTSVVSDLDNSHEKGVYQYVCDVPAHSLGPGKYFVTVGSDEPNVRVLFWMEDILTIDMVSFSERMSRYNASAWIGVTSPGIVNWRVE